MSHLFGRSPNGYHKARRSPHPFSASSSSGSSSALKEKLDLDAGSSPTSSSTTFFLPLPFSSNPHRRFKLVLPIPHRIYRRLPTVRVQSRKFLAVVLGLVLLLVWLLGKRKKGDDNGGWQPPWKDPDTLVFSKEELKSVWEWEIMSGHWPSARKGESPSFPSLAGERARPNRGRSKLTFHLHSFPLHLLTSRLSQPHQLLGPTFHLATSTLPSQNRCSLALFFPPAFLQHPTSPDLDPNEPTRTSPRLWEIDRTLVGRRGLRLEVQRIWTCCWIIVISRRDL